MPVKLQQFKEILEESRWNRSRITSVRYGEITPTTYTLELVIAGREVVPLVLPRVFFDEQASDVIPLAQEQEQEQQQ